MNLFQRWVFNTTPKFTYETFIVTMVFGLLTWFFISMFLYYVINPILISKFSKSGSGDSLKLAHLQISSLHCIIASLGATYSVLFADGVPNTTWFICDYFKLHMFDIQKYLMTLSLSYYLFSLTLNLIRVHYLNLALSIVQIALVLLGLRVEGLFGNIV